MVFSEIQLLKIRTKVLERVGYAMIGGTDEDGLESENHVYDTCTDERDSLSTSSASSNDVKASVEAVRAKQEIALVDIEGKTLVTGFDHLVYDLGRFVVVHEAVGQLRQTLPG